MVKTVQQDMWIRGFHAVAPVGTHHTVLSAFNLALPDGVSVCNGFVQGNTLLYGSGVGTDPLELPGDVAVRVTAGTRLLLNLHLYNASTTVLPGTSGIQVEVVDPQTVAHRAQLVLAGTEDITIPNTGATTLSGQCTFGQETTLMAMMPHMHTLGTHMKVTLTGGQLPDQVLMDDEYYFDDQRFRVLSPLVTAQQGQRLAIECTYYNDTDRTFVFGESTNDEMCYAALYFYPEAPVGVTCTN